MDYVNGLIKQVRKKTILVVGDIMLDVRVSGEVSRMSAEAPIPVFREQGRAYQIGGAGNVAANLKAMGQDVRICSVVGEDTFGYRVRDSLLKMGVDCSMLRLVAQRQTTVKTRYYTEDHRQLFRSDAEDTSDISTDTELQLLREIESELDDVDTIVFSDYSKGVLTNTFVQRILSSAREKHILTVADPKSADYSKYKGCTCIKPNKNEFSIMVKREDPSMPCMVKLGRAICRENDNEWIVVTLGKMGMLGISREEDIAPVYIPGENVEAIDVCGAGDTAISYLAGALSSGIDVKNAIILANLAAGTKVQKKGTAPVEIRELIAFHEKRITCSDLALLREKYKKQRIVFTNGCFDLLHSGHLSCLTKASDLGDVLVVGINSDASVKRLKGEERPIVPLEQRMRMLEALGCVDHVVPFDEDTPIGLIEQLMPDVLVKGKDYQRKSIVGADVVIKNGGRVELIDLEGCLSTTSLIERIHGKK